MTKFAILADSMVKQFKTGKTTLTAVDGLSLQVAPGETYGLIGPDGAGKSTTTRVILGLLNRTSGESSILGMASFCDDGLMPCMLAKNWTFSMTVRSAGSANCWAI